MQETQNKKGDIRANRWIYSFFGDGHPNFNEMNPKHWYINPTIRLMTVPWHRAQMGVYTHQHILKTHTKQQTSWWFQPIWKICSSNWIISPRFRLKFKRMRPPPKTMKTSEANECFHQILLYVPESCSPLAVLPQTSCQFFYPIFTGWFIEGVCQS